MQIQTGSSNHPLPTRSATPPLTTPPSPEPQDQVEIQASRAAQKKAWRQVEWASFAGQLVGGALVLSHQGGIGLAIFAASSATMVYAGYKGQRA